MPHKRVKRAKRKAERYAVGPILAELMSTERTARVADDDLIGSGSRSRKHVLSPDTRSTGGKAIDDAVDLRAKRNVDARTPRNDGDSMRWPRKTRPISVADDIYSNDDDTTD